jgi:hypothetical protein
MGQNLSRLAVFLVLIDFVLEKNFFKKILVEATQNCSQKISNKKCWGDAHGMGYTKRA